MILPNGDCLTTMRGSENSKGWSCMLKAISVSLLVLLSWSAALGNDMEKAAKEGAKHGISKYRVHERTAEAIRLHLLDADGNTMGGEAKIVLQKDAEVRLQYDTVEKEPVHISWNRSSGRLEVRIKSSHAVSEFDPAKRSFVRTGDAYIFETYAKLIEQSSWPPSSSTRKRCSRAA